MHIYDQHIWSTAVNSLRPSDAYMHLWVSNLTIIGSDNGLSPERRQAIIWTNAGILLIGPLGTNFSEILIEIQTFSLKKMRLKMSSAKCCSFRLGLNVLNDHTQLFPVKVRNQFMNLNPGHDIVPSNLSQGEWALNCYDNTKPIVNGTSLATNYNVMGH